MRTTYRESEIYLTGLESNLLCIINEKDRMPTWSDMVNRLKMEEYTHTGSFFFFKYIRLIISRDNRVCRNRKL